MKYDLVIRGGLVVEGTGREPFKADIAITGDRIGRVIRREDVATGMLPGRVVRSAQAGPAV